MQKNYEAMKRMMDVFTTTSVLAFCLLISAFLVQKTYLKVFGGAQLAGKAFQQCRANVQVEASKAIGLGMIRIPLHQKKNKIKKK